MAEINPSETPINGGGVPLLVGTSETVGAKRQRRPSVRLGDIGGDQPYESHVRRASSTSNRQWKHQLNPLPASKSFKTRTLTNLSSDFNDEDEKDPKSNSLDSIAIGSWRVRDSKKRGPATKRVRSNWVSKVDENGGGNGNSNSNGNGNGNNNNVEGEERYSDREDLEEFEMENSECPSKEQSPIHSVENNLGGDGTERDVFYNGRRPTRANRVRENNREQLEGVQLSAPSDNEMRRCGEDGVRIWLNSLGLGRYAPVFEIHEVDDEVLPMLTLEDLKDMGINAVGSRRKMFCAIQRLGKGFS